SHVQVFAQRPQSLPIVGMKPVEQLSSRPVGKRLEHVIHVSSPRFIMQPFGCMSRPALLYLSAGSCVIVGGQSQFLADGECIDATAGSTPLFQCGRKSGLSSFASSEDCKPCTALQPGGILRIVEGFSCKVPDRGSTTL